MPREFMIVDDNPEVLSSLEHLLSSRGYRANCFANSKAAVSWYQEKTEGVDFVLLDLQMPELSGEDCLEKIKQYNQRQPVALMSGSDDWNRVERSLRNGADIFFPKPLDFEALFQWAAVINSEVGHTFPSSC